MPDDSLYDESFVDVFCEFLEVVVHSFFYYSKYYDHVYFERRTKYKCMTYMCLVPDIVLYIHNLVQSVRPWIQRKQFHSIELEISTLEGTLLESMLIQASENTLSSSDLVDYSYLEMSFNHTLRSIAQISFLEKLPCFSVSML